MRKLTIDDKEFESFRIFIEKECAISLASSKRYLLETRLAKLVAESGCSNFTEFYRSVISHKQPNLKEKIIDAVTTNETLWFRDSGPWQAIRDVMLPSLVENLSSDKKSKIGIWSAACSTGQEPYSMAMLVHSLCKQHGLDREIFRILGTDISPSALFIAMAGRYDRISMNRGFSDEWIEHREAHFRKEGIISIISDEIKKMVQFKRQNLMDSFFGLGRFQIVLLRNVAIYFSDEFKRKLFEQIDRVIAPGGYLLLGSSETLQGYSDRLVAQRHGRTTFYQKPL